MALKYEVHISRNPYSDTIGEDGLRSLLDAAIAARAQDIESRHLAGEYERDRMAFVLLDPTAPRGRAADDIVLALALIGAEADFFAPNAIAKAFCQHDLGMEGCAVIQSQNHRLADGSFRFGGAIEVGGTVVGGSGQTEIQDRYQCTLLAADFNYRVAVCRKEWEEANGPGRWYSTVQGASSRFARIVDQLLGR